jgi:nicotinate phosphoribosyltransferase
VPIFGTMAHSYIQAHEDEQAAFEHFARSHPGNAVMLIDTYDTENAARRLVDTARRLAGEGIRIRAVRIDSGDLAEHARRVRRILDEGGLPEITVFASGNLDEWRLRDLLGAGAPIDGFGVGTRMNTSADKPYLDCAYKLQEYAGRARRKRSEGKATWPGRKQVWRRFDASGTMRGDTLSLEGAPADGEPLIVPVMRAGRRIASAPPLAAVRDRARTQIAALPEPLRALDPGPVYPVAVGEALQVLAREVDRAHAAAGR